jgi:hypothetical protein
MAAGSLPKPGSKYGPCLEPCQHKDCQLTREMATTPCRICGLVINYDRRFYDEGSNPVNLNLVHATCLENEIGTKAENP